MQRAVKPGEVVTAKTRARLFSAVPLAAAGNRVFLVDLHAEGIPHYFEGGIRPVHVYAKPVIVDLARRLGGDDIVLACTDAGRAKWVESLANELGVPASFVFKRRLDGSHTEVTAMSAVVAGKSVVIYDDMIRTGGSLIAAARAYKDAGAVKLTAIATHGVFPGDALQRLTETGLFSAIACTDTHPRARELAGSSLYVAGIAGVLTRALEESI
jgi:ribose-phosphate pyrophosphokinase